MTEYGSHKTDGHWNVPVDQDGNVVAYPQNRSEKTGETRKVKRHDGVEIDWPIYRTLPPVFEAFPPKRMRVKVIDMERGRSAARFTIQDVDTGKTYPMFMVDILAMLEDIEFEGTWTSQKRGQNYGIKRIEK